jgi:hypothetical protein
MVSNEGIGRRDGVQWLRINVATPEAGFRKFVAGYHRMKLMNCLNIHDVPGLVRLAMQAGLLPQEKLVTG